MSSVLQYLAFSKIAQNATFPTASLCKTPFPFLCDLTFCDITCHILVGELHIFYTKWHLSGNTGADGVSMSGGEAYQRLPHSEAKGKLKIGQDAWKSLSSIPVRKAPKSRSGRFITDTRMKCWTKKEISIGSGFSSAVWTNIQ